MDAIPVTVIADDPVSRAGVDAALRSRPEVRVLQPGQPGSAAVTLVVCEEVDEEAVRAVRKTLRGEGSRAVLVVTQVDDRGLFAAVEAGASGLLRRGDATPARLVEAIRAAAAGNGAIPEDLLGRLLDQVSRLHDEVLAPRGMHVSGLSDREVEVLRLVAEGCSTAEIARRLCYSERTIKNVIHDVTSRLHLRNRPHAVAYALRQGLI